MEEGDGMSRRLIRHARPNASFQRCRNAVDVTNGLAIVDRFAFVFARSVQNDSCMLIRRLKHNLPMTSSRGDGPIVAHLFTTTLLLGE